MKRIYAFAEWCYGQSAEGAWNAAEVAFYEHLVDDPVTFEAIPDWLSTDVFVGVIGLFRLRLNPLDFQWLCNEFSKKHGRLPLEGMLPEDEQICDGSNI